MRVNKYYGIGASLSLTKRSLAGIGASVYLTKIILREFVPLFL